MRWRVRPREIVSGFAPRPSPGAITRYPTTPKPPDCVHRGIRPMMQVRAADGEMDADRSEGATRFPRFTTYGRFAHRSYVQPACAQQMAAQPTGQFPAGRGR